MGQAGIRMGELDSRQQERLRAALGEMLAAHFAYPPSYSYRADRALVRPLDRAKRAELGAYVASIGFAPLERMEVDSPELRRYFEGVFLRYLHVNPQLTGPRAARHKGQLRAMAHTLAADVQREFHSFIEGRAPAFGAPPPPSSWADVFAPPARTDHTPTEDNTAELEALLARAQAQTRGGPTRGENRRPPHNPVQSSAVPPQGGGQLEAANMLAAPTASASADDRLVFAQLRYQLEAYIRQAVESYGLPDRGGDPARALDDLRTSGLVDEANLGVAESILALTDRVMARGSAAVEDYRQALTLYLLYHRSHLRG